MQKMIDSVQLLDCNIIKQDGMKYIFHMSYFKVKNEKELLQPTRMMREIPRHNSCLKNDICYTSVFVKLGSAFYWVNYQADLKLCKI